MPLAAYHALFPQGCVACNSRQSLSVDRVVPSQGYVPKNVVCLCMTCNQIKSDAGPAQIAMVLAWLVKRLNYSAEIQLLAADLVKLLPVVSTSASAPASAAPLPVPLLSLASSAPPAAAAASVILTAERMDVNVALARSMLPESLLKVKHGIRCS